MGDHNLSFSNATMIGTDRPETNNSTRLGFTIFAYFVILFVSLLGNFLIILIIYKNNNRRMRTVSNLFIVNMGVVDILFIAWSIPFSVKTTISGPEWLITGLLGKIICKFCHYLWHATIILSIMSLGAIAVDRFFLVFFPTRKILTLKSAGLLIAAGWIEALGFSGPVLYYTDISVFGDRQYCFMDVYRHKSLSTYTIVTFALYMAIPLFLLIIIYIAVIIKLWTHKPPGENVSRERLENAERTNCKIFCMLVTIVVSFAACWLPYWVATLHCIIQVDNFSNSSLCKPAFIDVTLLLTYINTALNPAIYFIFSDNYRKAVKLMCCRSGAVGNDTTVTQSRYQSRNRRDPEAVTEM